VDITRTLFLKAETAGDPSVFFQKILLNTGKDFPAVICDMTFLFHAYWLEHTHLVRAVYFAEQNSNVQTTGTGNSLKIWEWSVSMQPGFSEYTHSALHEKISEKKEISQAEARAIQDAYKPFVRVNFPFELSTVTVNKPWGKEIWFTGVEKRGVCGAVVQNTVYGLPWLFAAAGDACIGTAKQQLILLKILDTLPDPDKGDLYYEMHRIKKEVYIITGVDNAAWPDGTGEIKLGFNRKKIKQYGTFSVFLEEMSSAVKNYKKVRDAIDGYGNNEIPSYLTEQERELRGIMESYMGIVRVSAGDTICIPNYMPHSLRHGIRVLEFQTPVYERLIISFTQRVLTQNHWDTDEAFSIIREKYQDGQICYDVDNTSGQQNKSGENQNPDVSYGRTKIEKIVDFEDFYVNKILFSAGSSISENTGKSYMLVFIISGQLRYAQQPGENSILLQPGKAYFIPASCGAYMLSNMNMKSDNTDQAVCCIAVPKPTKHGF